MIYASNQNPQSCSFSPKLHLHPLHFHSMPPRKKVEPADPAKESAFAVKPKRIPKSEERIKVLVNPHPLIRHWVAVLRNKDTNSGDDFKNAMAELGRLLFYEASRNWLPTVPLELNSPMGAASVQIIDPSKHLAIVIILRAGLALAEHVASGLASRNTYHLGICREKGESQGIVYLNELPDKFPKGSRVFLVDPMVASGITLSEALKLIKERGVDYKNIKVFSVELDVAFIGCKISAIVARPTFLKLLNNYPGLDIHAGDIDNEVNEGFIVPGLGDAADRCFGI